MSETKVYTCVCKGVNKTPAVTHADYKALEERHAETVEGSSELGLQVVELTKELAALRGKVGELVEADHAYDDAWDDLATRQRKENVAKTGERRRLALEGLK